MSPTSMPSDGDAARRADARRRMLEAVGEVKTILRLRTVLMRGGPVREEDAAAWHVAYARHIRACWCREHEAWAALMGTRLACEASAAATRAVTIEAEALALGLSPAQARDRGLSAWLHPERSVSAVDARHSLRAGLRRR